MSSSADSQPTVAVVGASRDRSRFGSISLRAHLQQGYRVFPVNPNADEIEGLSAFPSLSDVPADHLNRITVYVPPEIGIDLLDEIANVDVDEVWFNPGSADSALRERAEELGLEIIEACSIVDLSINPSDVT
ncbi:MAG: CoA-binding protein [Planctomycetota bacterium]|jgi:predicted CoA-binding protein